MESQRVAHDWRLSMHTCDTIRRDIAKEGFLEEMQPRNTLSAEGKEKD